MNARKLDNTIREAVEYSFRPIPLEGGKFPFKKYVKMEDGEIDSALQSLTPPCNIGIITGERSNIIVVDVDVQNNGIQNFEELAKDNGIENILKINTPIVRTGSGGFHFYFKYEKALYQHLTSGTNFIEGYPGVDFKCNNGLVVYPGSIYPGCGAVHKCGAKDELDVCNFKGNRYTWITSPEDVEEYKGQNESNTFIAK